MSVYIDSTKFPLFPDQQADAAAINQSYFCGPILIGGALYMVLLDGQGASPTYALLVYKSIDNGSTWVLVSGTTQLSSLFFPRISVDYLGTAIWFLYATSGGSDVNLHLVAFDTATNTWGATANMPVSPAGTDLRAWDMTMQSDGTLNVIYTANVATVFSIWLIRYSGGVWGSHVQLTAASWEQSGILIDRNTDTTHLFISPRNIFGTGPLVASNHLPIASDGTPGIQTTLLAAPVTPNQRLYPSFDQGCIWNDQIIVPYTRNSNIAAVFVGTPISNPVWSSTDIPFPDDPLGQFSFLGFGKMFALVVDGNLNVLWCVGHWDVDFNVLSAFLMRSINTGSGFDNGEIVYDSSTDSISPAFADPTRESIALPSASVIPSGLGVAFQSIMDTTSIVGYDVLTNLYINIESAPPSLEIVCNNPPNGEVGTVYSHALSVTGGVPPYTVTIISGSLPPGLSLDSSTGLISGTPTLPGTYTFLAFVTDNVGSTAQVQCSIVITSSLLITCGNPPNGTVGLGYQTIIPVSGGVPPYVLSIVAGSLPTGLTLDPNTGIIGGTPTQAGTFTFTVSVADTNLTTANVVCSITIGQVSAGCTSLQSGTVGVPYSQAFQASGGTAPYTFAVIAGQLPFGLTLDPNTGVLSGTPLVLGTYQVTIQVTDANGVTATVVCIHIIGCQ